MPTRADSSKKTLNFQVPIGLWEELRVDAIRSDRQFKDYLNDILTAHIAARVRPDETQKSA